MTELSRRALLSGICGIAALSMVPISAEASTLVKKLPKGRLSFKVSDAAKIVDVGNSVAIGQAKGGPVGYSDLVRLPSRHFLYSALIKV
jgi:hypothetical protein